MRITSLVMAVGLIVVFGCGRETSQPINETPKTVQQLAEEAQRELKILSESLRRDVDEMLKEVHESLADDLTGKPLLALDREEGEHEWFVAPAELVVSKKEKDDADESEETREGDDVGPTPEIDEFDIGEGIELFTSRDGKRLAAKQFRAKATYTLSAHEKHFQIKLKGIQKITRTVLAEVPFEAVVEFEIVESTRVAFRDKDVPLPIPEPYRRPKDGEHYGELLVTPADSELLEGWDCPDEPGNRWAQRYGPFYPLEYRFPVNDEELSVYTQETIDDLIEDCLKAEQVEETKTETVTFRYSVAEKKWNWRWGNRLPKPMGVPSSMVSPPDDPFVELNQ